MSIIESVKKKIAIGERLNEVDARDLFACNDMVGLGLLANSVREKIHGDKTYFIKNRHIDYSNVCAIQCKFCAFSRKAGEEGAFEFSNEQMVQKLREGKKIGITELHIVGGFHPTHPWEFYISMLHALKKEDPAIHIKAFTAAEIRYFSKKFRKTEKEVLCELREAGRDSLPGRGAEILDDEVRK